MIPNRRLIAHDPTIAGFRASNVDTYICLIWSYGNKQEDEVDIQVLLHLLLLKKRLPLNYS